MKPTIHFLFIPAFILQISAGFAQTDSSKVLIQEGQLTENKYDDSYKAYIKQANPETRKLWKINLVDMYAPILSIGIECKLSKSFSSESWVKMGLPYRAGFYSPDLKWSISHSFKYYYNLNRRERLGRKTNGFQANYLSFDFFAGEDRNPKPGLDNEIVKDADSWYGIALKYGMQKRFGIFYIEPYIGVGYQYYSLTRTIDEVRTFNFKSDTWYLQFISGINAGIALESLFGHQNSPIAKYIFDPDSTRKYPVIWKANLVDLMLFKPNMGFEWRIAGNLTSETYLKFGLELKPKESANGLYVGEELSEMGVDQQFKYYLNFRRRLMHGKSTVGFSGNYVAIGLYAGQTGYNYELTLNELGYQRDWPLELSRYGLALKYGIQRRFGGIGFIDVFAGIALQKYEIPNVVRDFTISKRTNEKFLPVFGIRAGFGIGSGLSRDYKF